MAVPVQLVAFARSRRARTDQGPLSGIIEHNPVFGGRWGRGSPSPALCEGGKMRRPVTAFGQATCTDAVSQDVELNQLRVGHTIVWCRIVAREVAAVPTRIELLFRLANTEYYAHSGVVAAAGLTLDEYLGVHMPPEAQIIGRFVGATLADTLQVWAYGYYLEGVGEPEG